MMETGQLSWLLDVLPVAALLLLGISFLIRRHACRREEAELEETIRLFKQDEDSYGNDGGGYE